MSTLVNELRQLIAAFDENEIEYAVCGGLAMTIHGFPRATFAPGDYDGDGKTDIAVFRNPIFYSLISSNAAVSFFQ